jgi:hypothetical protein
MVIASVDMLLEFDLMLEKLKIDVLAEKRKLLNNAVE